MVLGKLLNLSGLRFSHLQNEDNIYVGGAFENEMINYKVKREPYARCWWLMPVILASQEAEIRRITVQSQPKQIVHETLSWKYPTTKRPGKVDQVIECLPSKCEALSSNSSTAKKKNKKTKNHHSQTLKPSKSLNSYTHPLSGSFSPSPPIFLQSTDFQPRG
jgi:hypothetical protein